MTAWRTFKWLLVRNTRLFTTPLTSGVSGNSCLSQSVRAASTTNQSWWAGGAGVCVSPSVPSVPPEKVRRYQ
jgi:hypothetical protein